MKVESLPDKSSVTLEISPTQQRGVMYFLLNEKGFDLAEIAKLCGEDENTLKAVFLEDRLLHEKSLASLVQLTWDNLFPHFF